jgi:hypothetical protein
VENPQGGEAGRPFRYQFFCCRNKSAAWRHSLTVKAQLVDVHFPTGTGGVMSKFERLLEAGSTELPDWRCAAEMNLMAIVPVAGGDTEIRIFRCPNCSHELRLTAWGVSAS